MLIITIANRTINGMDLLINILVVVKKYYFKLE